MPPEKKIVTLSVRMPESLQLSIRALAEAKGETESYLVRKVLVAFVEEERRYHRALVDIFTGTGSESQLQQCVTLYETLE